MSWYSLSVKPIEEYTSDVIAGICRSISAAGVCALVLLAAVCGCGPRFKFDGTWKGNRNIKPEPGQHPGVYRTLGQVTVKIESGRFKMAEMGMSYEGSVRTEGEKAFLTIESIDERPMDRQPKEVQDQMKEITLTAQKDGKIVFVDPGSYFTDPLTLEREKPEE